MPVKAIIRRLRRRSPTLDEQLNSTDLRAKFRAQGVNVGMYSYGCFDLKRVPAGVTVGRYCSFASSAQIFLRNHGLNFLGLTAYFYNRQLGVVDDDTIQTETLEIGDDVWLGHNSIILANVKTIGRGAAIAAGAVVTKPVPAYAVMAGNPARLLSMRFDAATIEKIEATRWWEKSPAELKMMIEQYPQMVFDPARYFGASTAQGPAS